MKVESSGNSEKLFVVWREKEQRFLEGFQTSLTLPCDKTKN
jgi:hypothetical protein